MTKNEDLSICKECGGYCCKKSGCDYWVNDLKNKSYEGILELLATGKVSIVAFMNFKTINGRLYNYPFLYLRARNNNRDIVDLLSMKTTCSNLTETGCSFSYEERPSGGKNLTPRRDEPCRPLENPIENIMLWAPYQKQLAKIVKKYTGKSVEKKIKEDVISLLYQVRIGDFKDVSPAELEDIRGLIPLLVECYPKEAKIAIRKPLIKQKK